MKLVFPAFFEDELKALIKKYPSIKNDLYELAKTLLDNPFSGSPLGHNCYKIRMAIKSKGRGKSGGARIITCVKIIEDSIYFLSIYDKSEQSTITDHELVEYLRKLDL